MFIKSGVKKIINQCIYTYYSDWNPLVRISNIIKNISAYIYSQRYCKLLNCKNVNFDKNLNTIKGEKYFTIGEGTGFGKFAVLTAWDNYRGESFTPKVVIGKNCNFGDYLHLTCINKISIGNGVLTGRWVTISDNDHGITDYDTLQISPAYRRLSCKGPVAIGDNVWIGDKATILSGVTIGDGAVIAANAVVAKNISPYSVAAGNPAKIIKHNIFENNE